MGRLKSLTIRELKFCYSFLGKSDFCAIKAAMDIGYNYNTASKSAYKILQRPLVKEFIKQKLDAMDKESQYTVAKKLDKLWHIATLSAPDTATHFDEMDGRTAISAINEMNKMQGHHMPTQVTLSEINTEEEKKRLEELQKEHKKDY